MDTFVGASIGITEAASKKLVEIMEEQGERDAALRIIAMPGGCSGFQYMMALEREVKEDDLVVDGSGVKIVVDADSALLLNGAEIDYIDTFQRSGFAIHNPNVPQGGTCACGGSGGCASGG